MYLIKVGVWNCNSKCVISNLYPFPGRVFAVSHCGTSRAADHVFRGPRASTVVGVAVADGRFSTFHRTSTPSTVLRI